LASLLRIGAPAIMLAAYWFILTMAVPRRPPDSTSRAPALPPAASGSRLTALEALHRASPRDARFLREIAGAYGEAGRHVDAAGAWQRYARQSPNPADACEPIVNAFRSAGRHGAAVQVLERCARLRPQDAGLWLAVGRHREEQAQRNAAAAAYYRASRLDWQSPAPWNGLARVRLAEGQHEQAHRAAMRALSMAPANVEALSLVAQALDRAGLTVDAERYRAHAAAIASAP
jgi:tetratricopeptide (TPR) repeat protein